MNERYLQVTFGGMLAGCAVPALAALNVHAQQTSILSSRVEPGIPYLPPVPSRVRGVRRVSMGRARIFAADQRRQPLGLLFRRAVHDDRTRPEDGDEQC